METFRRGSLEFPVRDTGPADGPVVLLLHGFPQSSACWDEVVPGLAGAGYRTLAPDQRGYAAGAQPRGRRAYRAAALVADVEALITASGARKVHLVGHDWGAAVAWGLAAERPDLVRTLTAVSVPHPAAFTRALVSSRQLVASWYLFAFQLPWLPERYLRSKGGERFARFLRRADQSGPLAARDAHTMLTVGALTPALNWYRAIPLTDPRRGPGRIRVPTMYVWSDGDVAIRRSAADRCGAYVSGPYRFEVLAGVSHWIPQSAPGDLTRLVLAHLAEHPITPG